MARRLQTPGQRGGIPTLQSHGFQQSPTASGPTDLVFPQEGDDSLAIGAEGGPHGSTPIVDRRVTLRPGRALPARLQLSYYLDPRANTRVATLVFHVRVPCVPSGPDGPKLSFNLEIKANQTEYNTDWLAAGARGLHGECVHCVRQDKSGAAHRMGVHLVVCGTHGIHIENSLAKDSSVTGRVGPAWSRRMCLMVRRR